MTSSNGLLYRLCDTVEKSARLARRKAMTMKDFFRMTLGAHERDCSVRLLSATAVRLAV